MTLPVIPPVRSGSEHFAVELRHLDLLLLRELARFERRCGTPSTHQGIYVSHEEVVALLTLGSPGANTPGGDAPGRDDPGPEDLDEAVAASRRWVDDAVHVARDAGHDLPLPRLAARLGLTAPERQILVACLAPELDHRYDRVYAYLQDDLARRRPTADLVTRLVCRVREEQWHALGLLAAQAPLLASGVLREVADPASPSGSSALARLLQVAPDVVAHLLGREDLDPDLAGAARLTGDRGHAREEEGDDHARVSHLLRILGRARSGEPVVAYLFGAAGAGQLSLARAVTAAWGRGALEVTCPALPSGRARSSAVASALRSGWLSGRPVILRDAGALLFPEPGLTREQVLDGALRQFPGQVLLTGEQPWPYDTEPDGVTVHRVRLGAPEGEARRRLWRHALLGTDLPVQAGWPAALASSVRLGPGPISQVAREVSDAALAHDPPRAGYTDWLEVARRRATARLEGLARLVPAHRGWDDLVLAPDRTAVLHEICDQVRLRDVVLGDWGMAARTGVARGIAVLFTGPPGTGKTMAAGVVAADLGLELFAIDLSQVVSKYIGETEKNLARVFDAAEDSGAVLLFDEADALFGARTEISDAHDRYANIETSYLLQRIEEYDGVAVLSTNLRQNMDDAFLRRLRFVVDFPLPDAAARRRIWERHLGGPVPLGELDLDLLAARLSVAGGSIRNMALAAAYLAAAEGAPLDMDHVMRAAGREFEKLGKLWRDPRATAGTQVNGAQVNGAGRAEVAR